MMTLMIIIITLLYDDDGDDNVTVDSELEKHIVHLMAR